MAEYLELEKVLDDSNIITVQTQEYGSIEVIPVDTITDIDLADVQPVIETEDLATVTEQFICKNCGIRIENFDKVVLEEDNDGYVDKLFYEYIFKFCPECGAKVR